MSQHLIFNASVNCLCWADLGCAGVRRMAVFGMGGWAVDMDGTNLGNLGNNLVFWFSYNHEATRFVVRLRNDTYRVAFFVGTNGWEGLLMVGELHLGVIILGAA